MKNLLQAGAIALAVLSCPPAVAQAYDPAKDPFASNMDAVAAQCTHWTVITPSDTVDLATYPKAIYVGTGGDIKMIGARAPSTATGVVWTGVAAASVLPVRPRRILATGTTASNILACF